MKPLLQLAVSAVTGAVAAAVVCMAWAGGGGGGPQSESFAAPTSGAAELAGLRSDPEWQALAARVAKLEESARLVPVPGSASAGRESAEAGGPDFEELREQLREFARTHRGAEGVAGSTPRELSGFIARREEDQPVKEPVTRASAEAVILDPTASEADKLAMHRHLRRLEDPYTDAMIDELLRIAETSPEEDLRSDAWTNFDGKAHLPVLVPRLMNAAQYDSSAAVRTEAAETLGNYLDDPAVRALLESIARIDLDKGVRDRAKRTLRSGG